MPPPPDSSLACRSRKLQSAWTQKPYAYAAGDPLLFSDPSGASFLDCFASFGAFGNCVASVFTPQPKTTPVRTRASGTVAATNPAPKKNPPAPPAQTLLAPPSSTSGAGSLSGASAILVSLPTTLAAQIAQAKVHAPAPLVGDQLHFNGA